MYKHGVFALLGILVGCLFSSDLVPAQTWTPDDLFGMKSVTDVSMSPDGSRIAYVLSAPDLKQNCYVGDVWVVSADGGKNSAGAPAGTPAARGARP